MRNLRKLLLLSGLLIFCAMSGAAQKLSSGTWELASIRQGRAVTDASASGIKLKFEAAGKFGGFNGCNSFSGNYRTGKNGALRLTPKISTLRACAPDQAQWESDFSAALTRIRVYSIGEDGRLYLTDTKNRATYSFVLAEGDTSSAALGGNWQLETIRIDDQVFSVGKLGATLNFGADGRYFGNTGCNSYSGQYEGGTSGRVKFGGAVMTRRACIGEEKQRIESDFRRLLEESSNYRLAEGKLYLTDRTGQNQLILQPATTTSSSKLRRQ